MKPGEKKNKRFKFHNDKGHDLNLEVFSNMPVVVKVTTKSIKVPFNEKTQSGCAYVKFVVTAPLTPCTVDNNIAIFERDDENKLNGLELFKFKLQTYE